MKTLWSLKTASLVALLALGACNTREGGMAGCLGGAGSCYSSVESQSGSLNSSTASAFTCTATAFPATVTPGQYFRVQVDTFGGTGTKSISGYVTAFFTSVSLMGQYNADKAGSLQTRTVWVKDASNAYAKCDFAVQVVDSSSVNGFACEIKASPSDGSLVPGQYATLSYRAINPPGAVTFSSLQANTGWLVDPAKMVSSSNTEGSAQVRYDYKGVKIASVEARSGTARVMCRVSFEVGGSGSSTPSALSGCDVKTAPLGFGGDGSQASMAGTLARIRAIPTGGTAPFTIRALSSDGTDAPLSKYFSTSAGPEKQPQLIVRYQRPGSAYVKVELKDSVGAVTTCQTYHVISPNDALSVAMGANDSENGSMLQVRRGSAATLYDEFPAFENSFRGDVRIANADFDGDGIADTLAATGPAGGQRVRVYKGDATPWFQGKGTPALLLDTTALLGAANDDFHVAAGDIDRDGHADIAMGLGCSNPSSSIRVISGNDDSKVLAEFTAPLFGGQSTGIAAMALGDINTDGYNDLILSPCKSGIIQVLSGKSLALNYAAGTPNVLPTVLRVISSAPGFAGSLPVAAGDVNNDGVVDVIVGPGDNAAYGASAPKLRVYSGSTGSQILGFQPLPGETGTFSVAAADFNGDGNADLAVAVSGSVSGDASLLQVYNGYPAMTGVSSILATISPFAGFFSEIFLGAGGG